MSWGFSEAILRKMMRSRTSYNVLYISLIKKLFSLCRFFFFELTREYIKNENLFYKYNVYIFLISLYAGRTIGRYRAGIILCIQFMHICCANIELISLDSLCIIHIRGYTISLSETCLIVGGCMCRAKWLVCFHPHYHHPDGDDHHRLASWLGYVIQSWIIVGSAGTNTAGRHMFSIWLE